jgi:hypothetical protein
MLLSCPGCGAKFNLGNVQAEHVKCPICYNIWQINVSRAPFTKDILPKSEKVSLQNKILNYSKYVHMACCFIVMAIAFYQCTQQLIRHFYLTNQVQIRDLRWSILDGNTQVHCQVDNTGDKTIRIYRADLIRSVLKKEEKNFVWAYLVLPPYASLNFDTSIPGIKDSIHNFDLTVQFK